MKEYSFEDSNKHTACFWWSMALCAFTLVSQIALCIMGNAGESKITEPYNEAMDNYVGQANSLIQELGEPFEELSPWIDRLGDTGKRSMAIASKGVMYWVISAISWLLDIILFVIYKKSEGAIITDQDKSIFRIASILTAVIPFVFGVVDMCSWANYF